MNRKSEEKELNEILERLVAGEKIIPGPDMSAEMREKILAAEKLLECTADPSPEFEKRLKSMLVNRFASREAAGAVPKSGRVNLEEMMRVVPYEVGSRSCPVCFHPVEHFFANCPNCSLPLILKCSDCGKRLQTSWKACPYCGKAV